MQYHPDKVLRHIQTVNSQVRETWDRIRGNDDLTDHDTFKEAFISLLEETDPAKTAAENRAREEVRKGHHAGKNPREVMYTN